MNAVNQLTVYSITGCAMLEDDFFSSTHRLLTMIALSRLKLISEY